jgi:hypothetical protein
LEDSESGNGEEEQGRYFHAPTVIEALEHYTAKHGGDSLDDILDWPWQRFEAMYVAMIKREMVDELTNRKTSMLAALHANSGWTKDEDLRNAIEGVESNFEQSVALVYGDTVEDEDIDWDDPFFAPVKNSMDRMNVPNAHGDGEITTKEMVDLEKDMKEAGFDQL